MSQTAALLGAEAGATSASVGPPLRRMLRAYALEAKYESIRMLRAPAFAGPFLLLPVALYLLFAVVLFGDGISKDPKAGTFLFVGFSVLGTMGPGLFGFGMTVATERELGLLKLRRALPAPPAAWLIAKTVMAMLFVALVMVTMFLAAPLGHVRLDGPRMLGVALVNIFGAVPFCALGFFIGAHASGRSAPALVNLVYLPMIYLSGFLFPLPQSLQWLTLISPASWLHQLALRAIGAPVAGSPAMQGLALAAFTVFFMALAIRRLARVG